MHDLNDIHPVAEFHRNTDEYVRRLKETGRPEYLEVNGQAEVVVQSAEAYQKLLDTVEAAESVAAIRRSIEQVERGEVRPAREFCQELAAKYGITLE